MASMTDKDTPDTETGERGAGDDCLDAQDGGVRPVNGRVRSRIRQAPHRSAAPDVGAIALLLIALAVGYYVVVALPTHVQARHAVVLQVEAMRLDREREKERQLAGCLDIASQNYTAGWDFACQQRGMEADCVLPGWRAETRNRAYIEMQELCVKKYK